ncbi:MAG: sigma-70 family RNA polymerase sigma factor [Phaeodactylibacter sp.]|nr:sigma-70 family RNA polymerase sigma factor [Phaeodactylibacter sp.]MCB9289335.1 sigma-70 family RNA polymerase sigma factor [Lewinellaceae bacterium]
MDEDIKLVESCLNGSRSAFQQLVERYQDYVFTIAMRVLKSREEAEEAAQDTFIKVYRTLGTFEKKSKFSTWLYTIAYRTAVDKARLKQLPTSSIDDEESYIQLAGPDSENPAAGLYQKDLNSQLKAAIGRLKPTDAALITLFYLHEKPVKEVAEILGLSLSNAKTKLHRLREVLKTELSNQLETEIEDLL